MVETNPIHPDVRKFARETGAKEVRPMMSRGSGRVVYDMDNIEIIHISPENIENDIPDGFRANLTFGPTSPTIDLFPDR